MVLQKVIVGVASIFSVTFPVIFAPSLFAVGSFSLALKKQN